RQRPLVLLVAQDDDRHVGHGIEGEATHLHLDEHTASSGTVVSVARRLCGMTSVMRTLTTSPTAVPLPSKFTTRLQRVRPASSPGFRFDAPSTSTSTSWPASRALRAAPTRSATASSRALRLTFTSSGTWSPIAAAGVPGRRE